MKIQRFAISAGMLFIGAALASAETMDAFLADYQTLSAKEKVARIEKAMEMASDENMGAYRLLLNDAKYEEAKRQIASQMLSLAESRASSKPDVDSATFAGQAANYDALAILQSIPLAWLITAERERALSLLIEIDNRLRLTQSQPAEAARPVQPDGNAESSIDEARAMVDGALESASRENLSLISEAVPNGVLREALKKCEDAREVLMAQSPDQTASSRARWEAAMLELGKAVSVLKQRQALKYTLWAEGRYRESNPSDVSRKPTEQEAMAFYRRLSEVNVSLVAEPSLAREITKRLYELYDNIESLKSKERIRYDSIISLDKRKTLEDF